METGSKYFHVKGERGKSFATVELGADLVRGLRVLAVDAGADPEGSPTHDRLGRPDADEEGKQAGRAT
jgi:hypothetical protein